MTAGLLGKVAHIIGTPEAGIKILISLLLGYPIALVYRKVFYGKSTLLQYFYLISTGFLLGYFNFGYDIFHCVFAVLFTYATLFVFGGSATAVAITFVFNMTYLLTGYYYSGTNEYDINWTVPFCVLVLRLIGIAFDMYDGRQSWDSLSNDSKKVALVSRPGFLEFCAYALFPTTFLIGPQFSMKRFQDYVNGEFSDKKRQSEPPDSVHYALRRFFFGFVYMILFQLLGFLVTDDYMYSDEFAATNFFKRCFMLGLWGRYNLYRYISCWLFAEGGCIMFGISHNGKDEKGAVLWNGVENVKLSVIENTTQFNHYIQSFNVNTNHWVAQYVYKRLKFMNNRYFSQAAALLFLAVWHGLHSGYYVCFLFEFLVIYLEKDLQSILKSNEELSRFLTQNKVVSGVLYVALRVYTFVFMGWCLLPFVLLTYDKYWKAYSAVNYMGIFLYVLWPVFYGPIVRLLLAKKRQRVHAD